MGNNLRADPLDGGSALLRLGTRTNFVSADQIKMRRAQWLDTPMGPGWAVKTGLGIMAGVQGLGKSTLAMGCAATVSQKADVLVFSAEDDPNTTLVPRLAAAGADLSRVHLFMEREAFAIGDDPTGLLVEAVQDYKAKLVVFDPVIAYMPGQSDSYRDQDVRRVFRALQGASAENKFAAIGIMHFKKDGSGGGTEALYRVGGSIAFTAAPRSVFCVAEVNGKLVLVHLKCNVGKEQKSRCLDRKVVSVGGGIKATVLEVGGESSVTKQDLVGPPKKRGPEPVMKAAAKSWLLSYVSSEGTPIAQIREAADAEGFSWATVKVARHELVQIQSVTPKGSPKPTMWKRAADVLF